MVNAVGGIRSVFASAVYGIRTATDHFGKNAAAISRQSVVDYQDSVQFSSAGRALAAKSQPALAAAEPQRSLEQSLIGQMIAKNELAANVSSLRTADEVLQTLVRLGERDR
jgi:hypothetical protein